MVLEGVATVAAAAPPTVLACCGAGWKMICPEGVANSRPADAGREDIHAGRDSGRLATSSLLVSATELPAGSVCAVQPGTEAFADPATALLGPAASAVMMPADAGGRERTGGALACR